MKSQVNPWWNVHMHAYICAHTYTSTSLTYWQLHFFLLKDSQMRADKTHNMLLLSTYIHTPHHTRAHTHMHACTNTQNHMHARTHARMHTHTTHCRRQRGVDTGVRYGIKFTARQVRHRNGSKRWRHIFIFFVSISLWEVTNWLVR